MKIISRTMDVKWRNRFFAHLRPHVQQPTKSWREYRVRACVLNRAEREAWSHTSHIKEAVHIILVETVMMVRMFTFCRLVSLLLPVLSFVRVESTLYYELVPYITLRAPGLGSETLIGDFASYSNHPDTQDSPLVFVPDDFGCPTWNDTINTSSHPRFTLILRLTQDCTDYEQASAAQQLGAEGVIFYYTRGSDYDTLGSKPDSESRQIRIAVVSLELDEDDVQELMANTSPTVSIHGEYRQSFQTSHTFYFVVFAFCILMLLSCLWFALSYIKRCHYNVQNRRRRVSTAVPWVSNNQLVRAFHKAIMAILVVYKQFLRYLRHTNRAFSLGRLQLVISACSCLPHLGRQKNPFREKILCMQS